MKTTDEIAKSIAEELSQTQEYAEMVMNAIWPIIAKHQQRMEAEAKLYAQMVMRGNK